MADYIRARSPERKQELMNAIMEVAGALLQKQPCHQIVLNES